MSSAGIRGSDLLLACLTSIVLLNLTLQHLVEHGDTAREEETLAGRLTHIIHTLSWSILKVSRMEGLYNYLLDIPRHR